MTGIEFKSGDLLTAINGGTSLDTNIDSLGKEFTSSGGIANTMTIGFGGSATIFRGGIDNDTTIGTGGFLFVSGGGVANDTVVLAVGSMTVESGTSVVDTLVTTAELLVSSGGSAFGTVLRSDGNEDVHGTDSGAYLSSGDQTVYGTTIDTVVSGVLGEFSGLQIVSGGIASGTVLLSNGQINVAGGSSAFGLTVHAGGAASIGDFFINSGSGSVIDATINGGLMIVYDEGTETNTVLENNGYSFVASGGVAAGVTIAGVSELEVGTRSTLTSGVHFIGSDGELAIIGTDLPATTLSGFSQGDLINLESVAYDSDGSAVFDQTTGLLAVTEGGAVL